MFRRKYKVFTDIILPDDGFLYLSRNMSWLFWDVTQGRVLVSYDVSGQTLGADTLLRNVGNWLQITLFKVITWNIHVFDGLHPFTLCILVLR
jgi:hypothetical protein